MQLTIGPVAVTAILTAEGVRNLQPATPAEFIEGAIALGFLSGVFLICMGLLHVGFVMDFLSTTVYTAFISAAACIIIVSQLKDLLGVNITSHTFLSNLYELAVHIQHTNLYAFSLSLVCLAILLLWKMWKKIPKWLPGELVVMAGGILLSYVSGLDSKVRVVGEVPSGLPSPQWPNVTRFPFQVLLSHASTISFVSYIGKWEMDRKYILLFSSKKLIYLTN